MTAEELLERYAAGERDFSGINVREAYLEGAVLTGINLSRANLQVANLKNAILDGAILQNTILFESNIECASLMDANLTGANLQQASTERRKSSYYFDETGGLGDWETGRLGDWETGGLGDWETGGLGDWGTGRLGDWGTDVFTLASRTERSVKICRYANCSFSPSPRPLVSPSENTTSNHTLLSWFNFAFFYQYFIDQSCGIGASGILDWLE